MTTPSRVVRTTAAFFCAVVLAACGGGGGGGTSGGSGVVPQATPTPAPVTKTQARAAMQSSLEMVQSANGVSLSGTGTLAIVRRVQAIHHGRRAQSVAGCSGGFTRTIVTNPDGSTTETDNIYYDALCASIEESDIITIPATATLQNLTATGTITTYARSGSVTSYATFRIALTSTLTVDTITIAETVSATVGGPPVAKLGATCVGPPSGASIHCGDAVVVTAAGQQTGVSLDEAVTFATSGATSTATATATASAYAAASGLDVAAGTAPAWTVTGAAPIETIAGSVTIAFSGSTATSGAIAITDVTDGISIGGTVTPTTVTLTASAHGVIVATVVVDQAGNGTIAYGDGTTATIAAWTING